MYMLSGPPCVGKSTYVEKMIKDRPDAYVASTDRLLEKIAVDEGISYTEAWQQKYKYAERQMLSHISYYSAKNRDIIWDQTNLTPKTRLNKRKRVPSYYVHLGIYFTDIDIDELLKRNEDRENKYIPPFVIRTMAKDYLVPKELEELEYVQWMIPFGK